MSDTQAQGSIFLKILVVLATLILIAVILIPGQIWDNEEQIKKKTLYDIESVYEAHRYYYNLNQEYTDNIDTLLTTISNDSALKVRKQVVDYTTQLKTAIDNFFEKPIIEALVKITQNINNIETDFENNRIYFANFPDIEAKAEELNFKVAVMKAGVDQENYSMMAKALDSLLNLSRDLTDYQLQVAARHSYSLTSSIVEKLPNIDFKSIAEYWAPLDKELTNLMLEINSTKLKQRTSVADRVADFQQSISSGLRSLQQSNIATEISNTSQASGQVNSVYELFLSDFLTTEKYVQYSLSKVDSMLLTLDKNNFYTPLDNKLYIVQFMDTLGLIVEDPTLLDELQGMAQNQVEEIKTLPFFDAYNNYLNVLDSINAYAAEVKIKYRRNAEVHFKTKDLDAVITELKSTSTLNAYSDLRNFVLNVPESHSYSEIKTMVENALLGVGLFKQIAETNIYGQFDTVHIDLVKEMDMFNELLSGIRRNTYSFDEKKAQISEALDKIKNNTTAGNLTTTLEKIESDLQDTFFFATEGKDEMVYGIFSTKVVNQGKMYGRTGEKSWEEE